MPENQRRLLSKTPDFDVIAEDPDKCAVILKDILSNNNFTHVKVVNHDPIGEIIPYHVEIKVGKETIAFIYKPIACHSYNKIHIENKMIQVATIDTILTFYLAFVYANLPYYNKDRLLCMAKFLFEVEDNNRLAQRGLLKRFSINCYGNEATIEDMRAAKSLKYKELMNDRNSREYEMYFLKYSPENKYTKKLNKTMKNKKQTVDSKKQTVDSKKQTVDSKKQTVDSKKHKRPLFNKFFNMFKPNQDLKSNETTKSNDYFV
jgi:hypothetical protein